MMKFCRSCCPNLNNWVGYITSGHGAAAYECSLFWGSLAFFSQMWVLVTVIVKIQAFCMCFKVLVLRRHSAAEGQHLFKTAMCSLLWSIRKYHTGFWNVTFQTSYLFIYVFSEESFIIKFSYTCSFWKFLETFLYMRNNVNLLCFFLACLYSSYA